MAEDTVPSDSGGVDTEDLDATANRLEAALERIERYLTAVRPAQPPAELVARLDALIGRLRGALGSSSASGQD
jgi:hypothetical protein